MVKSHAFALWPTGRQFDLEGKTVPDSSVLSKSVHETTRLRPWIGFGTPYFYPAEVTSYTLQGHVQPTATQATSKYEKPADFIGKGVREESKESVISPTKGRVLKKHKCHECERSFVTETALRKHQHPRKEFACKYCEKKYVSLGALKMHIRTHTLPCKCTICGKAFSRPWLLQGHIRTHTGEKPYKCPNCQRAFADRSNLRAHLQTHSAVKKYSCDQCSRSFSRMSLLLKHQHSCGEELNLTSWILFSMLFNNFSRWQL